MVAELYPCLQPEAGLEHIPVLETQRAQKDSVVGVGIEMQPVAAVLAGVEIVRSPNYRTVLRTKREKYNTSST